MTGQASSFSTTTIVFSLLLLCSLTIVFSYYCEHDWAGIELFNYYGTK